MRFLDTQTGQFVDRAPETRFAILSHTWDPEKGEQTYEELRKIQQRYVGRGGAGPESGSLSSPEQGGPPPTAPLSHLPHDSPLVSTTLPTLSSLAASQIQTNARASIDALSSDDLARFANNPSAPSSHDHLTPRKNDLPNPPSSDPPTLLPKPQSKALAPPPVAAPVSVPSKPSKSWVSRRLAQLKRWSRCQSSIGRVPHIPTDPPVSGHTPVDVSSLANPPVRLPVKDGPPVPSSDEPPVPSKDPVVPSSNNPPILASSAPSMPLAQFQSQSPPQSIWDDPELSPKIRDACAVAAKNGYHYIWIDSCCIDKSSSSELSEAINSMYAWYALADVCYAYLADVPPRDDHHAQGSNFRGSRWFTRGWTLQELIAPRWVEFLAKDWTPIGSKQALVNLVRSITNINYKALLHLEPLEGFSVAQRLSWAANRKTTRAEDRAYSLLGIFDIHMPTLYGEGDRAFRRLQEQIMQRIPDQSLFAWGTVYSIMGSQLRLDSSDASPHLSGRRSRFRRSPFAMSPDAFESSGSIRALHRDSTQSPPASYRHEIEYTSTPYGIRTSFRLIPLTPELLVGTLLRLNEGLLELRPEDSWYLAVLGCEHAERPRQLLGRVCYIPPSEPGVEMILFGSIGGPFERQGKGSALPGLFPLPPEIIERYCPTTEPKTVYIPHPDRIDLASTLPHKPQAAIMLVLLTETTDVLRSRGYSADLRDPVQVPDHPTVQRLTLSNDNLGHRITVEFQYTLQGYGHFLTIDAHVKLLKSYLQPDSTSSDSSQAAHRSISWTHAYPWRQSQLHNERVRLSGDGDGTLVVDLELEFAGAGVYILRVDIPRDEIPAQLAVKSAVDEAKEAEAGGHEIRCVEARERSDTTGDRARVKDD